MYEIRLEIDNREKLSIPDKDEVRSEGQIIHVPKCSNVLKTKVYLRVLKSVLMRI